MPELPEVEVTRRGIAAQINGRVIESVTVRNKNLRWPVPAKLSRAITGATVVSTDRRGKFILMACHGPRAAGIVLLHLGMTGTLRIIPASTPLRLHDHVDFRFGESVMRFNDPRRFGAILWHDAGDGDVFTQSRHLRTLGVEPLSEAFAGATGGLSLYRQTRGRALAVKQMLLAGQVVVGVGNIYASESLFRARIDPRTASGRIGLVRYQRLAEAIRVTLSAAIEKGGSTLRDFVDSAGAAGYFQQEYFVYDRAGLPCRVCATTIRALRQGQRSTFYCPNCQRG
jgi:formamidopyrimidine-DNA glycosylase